MPSDRINGQHSESVAFDSDNWQRSVHECAREELIVIASVQDRCSAGRSGSDHETRACSKESILTVRVSLLTNTSIKPSSSYSIPIPVLGAQPVHSMLAYSELAL